MYDLLLLLPFFSFAEYSLSDDSPVCCDLGGRYTVNVANPITVMTRYEDLGVPLSWKLWRDYIYGSRWEVTYIKCFLPRCYFKETHEDSSDI